MMVMTIPEHTLSGSKPCTYLCNMYIAPSVEPSVRGNPIVIIKYFNRCICYTHIDLIFDILIRHGVVHLVYCDMMVNPDCGLFPLSQFKGGSRQRSQ